MTHAGDTALRWLDEPLPVGRTIHLDTPDVNRLLEILREQWAIAQVHAHADASDETRIVAAGRVRLIRAVFRQLDEPFPLLPSEE